MPKHKQAHSNYVKGIENPNLNSSEIKNICQKLKLGNVMTNFSISKKKPEQRTFYVDLETRQLTWGRNAQTEGYINLQEVKEIRSGKVSKDFDRLQDDARKLDSKACFSIFYGNEFNLKVLSVAAKQPDEKAIWCRGLSHLVIDTFNASYPLQIKRFLSREFYQISKKSLKKPNDRSKSEITLNIAKTWLLAMNAKNISNHKVKEVFQGVNGSKKGDLNFEKFIHLYYDLMYLGHRKTSKFVENYSSDKLRFNAFDFQKFLRDEQKESWCHDFNAVKKFMNDYIADPSRGGDSIYFTMVEMVTYLFSKENSIWNEEILKRPSPEILSLPLSQYWISTSHNTYLSGDQIAGQSSIECYARALRMGCRCIELDCWDGSDGMPMIFHGRTLVGKIKFLDVLQTIKEHAFVVSDLPVILSIENHCKLIQQRQMAAMFSDVFGDMLLVRPVSANENCLPSPNQLRRKIIIKHKKLVDRSSETFTDTLDVTNDRNNSIKHGLMYMEDPVFKEWNRHFFVLTEDKKLVFSEELNNDENEDGDSGSGTFIDEENNTEPHKSEAWYHGKISKNQADYLLRNFNGLDGSFLVRDSMSVPGNFALSFKYRKGSHSVRIGCSMENGRKSYYLVPTVCFDSLSSLVSYYQQHPLKNTNINFELHLTESVPQDNPHETEPWYYDNMSRTEAESVLARIAQDGTFLVRKCTSDDPTVRFFAISFWAEGKVKHCRIKQVDKLYLIGNSSFETLCAIIKFYRKNTLFRKIKLRHPATRELNEKLIKEIDLSNASIYAGVSYVAPNPNTVTVKAIYDYIAQQPDDLSFSRGALITNVEKEEENWWKGDCDGMRGKWFPCNYVEEIEQPPAPDNSAQSQDDSKSLGSYFGAMQKGYFDFSSCKVELAALNDIDKPHSFIIRNLNGAGTSLACLSQTDWVEWLNVLQELASKTPNTSVKAVKSSKQEIAVELSDLIVYCRPVAFKEDCRKGNFYEMSSLSEGKAERMASKEKVKGFVQYNQHQFSRIYPAGLRVDSSNYNPLSMWNAGCQLIALNFQTGDRNMQLNEARFEMYGRCGYVPQDKCMRHSSYDPYVKSDSNDVEPLILNVQVIAARHLPKPGNGIACPFVEVEIQGCEFDNNKARTQKIDDNGFNPFWNDENTFAFDIHCPGTAFMRFTVCDQDMFGDPNVIATSVIPVPCIKPGIRSVPLKNMFSEEIHLASLLVHVDIRNKKEEDKAAMNAIQGLRDQALKFQSQLSQGTLNSIDMFQFHQQTAETQRSFFNNDQRRRPIPKPKSGKSLW